jgi:predicted molibdopterin-dependent oxidoreductase YjgC
VNLRAKQTPRKGVLTIVVNGRPLRTHEGDTVHAALTAAGILGLRASRQGEVRGAFCGMGICYECLVTIDGVPHQRACMRVVEPGMTVVTENADL